MELTHMRSVENEDGYLQHQRKRKYAHHAASDGYKLYSFQSVSVKHKRLLVSFH